MIFSLLEGLTLKIKDKPEFINSFKKVSIVIILSAIICYLEYSKSIFNYISNIRDRKEIKDICSKTGCDPEAIIKVSPKEYKRLSRCVFKYRRIKLENYCFKGNNGNMFFYDRNGREAYSKAVLVGCNDKSHPIYNTRPTRMIYVDYTDPIFENIKYHGYPIPGIKNGSIFVYDTDLITGKPLM